MKVYHHNDLDGQCSAAIVHGWAGITDGTMPEYIEMDYAKPFELGRINPLEQVWIVDFSIKPEIMLKLLDITRNVTWIDHHKSAIEMYKDFSLPLRGIRDTADAACVLTWKYIHWYTARGQGSENFKVACPTGLEVPRGVAMIGDYDAWHHKIPNSTAFYEGMKLRDSKPGSDDWWRVMTGEARGTFFDGRPLPVRDVCGPIIHEGETCIKYRDMYCKDMVDNYGWVTEIEGIKTWATNIYRFGSLGFGNKMNQYGICAACVWNGSKWTVSLYTKDARIDVSEICKRRGGGGHKGAAGYTSETLQL